MPRAYNNKESSKNAENLRLTPVVEFPHSFVLAEMWLLHFVIEIKREKKNVETVEWWTMNSDDRLFNWSFFKRLNSSNIKVALYA